MTLPIESQTAPPEEASVPVKKPGDTRIGWVTKEDAEHLTQNEGYRLVSAEDVEKYNASALHTGPLETLKAAGEGVVGMVPGGDAVLEAAGADTKERALALPGARVAGQLAAGAALGGGVAAGLSRIGLSAAPIIGETASTGLGLGIENAAVMTQMRASDLQAEEGKSAYESYKDGLKASPIDFLIGGALGVAGSKLSRSILGVTSGEASKGISKVERGPYGKPDFAERRARMAAGLNPSEPRKMGAIGDTIGREAMDEGFIPAWANREQILENVQAGKTRAGDELGALIDDVDAQSRLIPASTAKKPFQDFIDKFAADTSSEIDKLTGLTNKEISKISRAGEKEINAVNKAAKAEIKQLDKELKQNIKQHTDHLAEVEASERARIASEMPFDASAADRFAIAGEDALREAAFKKIGDQTLGVRAEIERKLAAAKGKADLSSDSIKWQKYWREKELEKAIVSKTGAELRVEQELVDTIKDWDKKGVIKESEFNDALEKAQKIVGHSFEIKPEYQKIINESKKEIRIGNRKNFFKPALAQVKALQKHDIPSVRSLGKQLEENIKFKIAQGETEAMTLREMRDYRASIDAQVKDWSSANRGAGAKASTHLKALRSTLEDSVEKEALKLLKGTGREAEWLAKWKKSKKTYQVASALEGPVKRAVDKQSTGVGPSFGGAGDLWSMMGGTLVGGPIGGIALPLIRRFLKSDRVESALANYAHGTAKGKKLLNKTVDDFLEPKPSLTKEIAKKSGAQLLASAISLSVDKMLEKKPNETRLEAVNKKVIELKEMQNALSISRPEDDKYPGLNNEIKQTVDRTVAYLQQVAPQPFVVADSPLPDYLKEPSQAEVIKFAKALYYIENGPEGFLEAFGSDQTISPDYIQAMQTVYPEAMGAIKDAFMDKLSKSKKALSHAKRKKLSPILGVSLELTDDPKYINMLQMTYSQKAAQEQEQTKQNMKPINLKSAFEGLEGGVDQIENSRAQA